MEKLVSNDCSEYEGWKAYHIDSPAGSITEKITLLAPSDLELYTYPYKQVQTQQLIFATKKDTPIILSIIQKKNVFRPNGIVDLTYVGWLDRFESMQVLKRLVSNPENVQIGDCKIHREQQYPLYDGMGLDFF